MSEWDDRCAVMEKRHKPLREFMSIWGAHCGAPRDVFLGHVCKLLIGCYSDGMSVDDDNRFNEQWDSGGASEGK